MKPFFRIFFTAAPLLPLNLACVQHNIPTVECLSDSEISYADQVAPIVSRVCATAECHSGPLGPDRNWLDFEAFQAHASEVRRRITLPNGHPDHMPRKGTLSESEIQTIICWVEQGAAEN